VRDLPVAGRPVVLCWVKRIWCCPHPLCEQRTWTERHEAIAPRATLTERARAWAFEQVGRHDAAVARTATTLGVAWWTVMRQVIDRGTGQVEDPARLEDTAAVGVDKTAYLRVNATRSTTFATGIADLSPGRPARLLDVVEGRSGSVLAASLGDRDSAWRAGITTASLDPFRGYATALTSHLPDAVRVLDPFHVVRVRREAPCVQVGCKDPPPVCRSRPVELRAA
jgi:transposase